MSAAKNWKMSAEYRPYFKTWVHPAIRWTHGWQFFSVGRQMMNGPDGRIVALSEGPEAHAPAQPFFSRPSALFVPANADTTDHRGVVRDFLAARTAKDGGAGRDPALERCRAL
jgi:hypothetical protein